MGYITTISVSPEFMELAKVHHISWTEAARVGMSIMLADIGVQEYDNSLNLFRKMRSYQKTAEDALQKLADLDNGELEKQKK